MPQKFFSFFKRTGDHVNGNEFTHSASRDGTRFCCGFHRTHISAHEYGDVAIQQIFFTDQDDIRGLHHCIGGFHGADETARLNHPECFHGVRTYQNPCTKAIDGTKRVSI